MANERNWKKRLDATADQWLESEQAKMAATQNTRDALKAAFVAGYIAHRNTVQAQREKKKENA